MMLASKALASLDGNGKIVADDVKHTEVFNKYFCSEFGNKKNHALMSQGQCTFHLISS